MSCFGFESGFSGSFLLGKLLCFFLGYALFTSLVDVRFVFFASLSLLGSLSLFLSLAAGESFLAVSFPGVETTFGLLLAESAFLYTAAEVPHQQHAFARQNVAGGIGGLCALLYPIQSAVEVQTYCSRISVRIIGTYPFNKSAISWRPAIGDYNRVERVAFAAMQLQSDLRCHNLRSVLN